MRPDVFRWCMVKIQIEIAYIVNAGMDKIYKNIR
jgi:hypothetical protein